jgi:O-antigen/teichoic acid export membrane protein
MSQGRTFLVSVSTLMMGTGAAQAITFGASFLLARLYGPAEFGHYSIFVGYVAVLGAASTGALDRIVLLGRSAGDARRAATVALFFAACVAAAISIVGMILSATGTPGWLPLTAVDIALFAPLFILSYAGCQVFAYSCLREHRVGRLATAKVVQSATMAVTQVLASIVRQVPGLIVGYVVAWTIMLIAGLRWRLIQGHLAHDLRRRTIMCVIQRHWRYPRYIMPNELLDNLSNQAPLFLIGVLVSVQSAGHYGLALMMLSAPAALLGQAVGQAFLQYVGRQGHDGRALRQAMVRVWCGMGLIGAVPFATVMIFGPAVFGMAFGQAWEGAGTIAQNLAPLLLARFASSPTSSIYLKLNLQREQWWFALAGAFYRTAIYASAAFGIDLVTLIRIQVMMEIVAIVIYNQIALRRLNSGDWPEQSVGSLDR